MSTWKERQKINKSYSSYKAVLFGVPQGSITGPLLFNIFTYDLFTMIDDVNIAKYVDDNIPFLSGDTPLHVIAHLENAAEKPCEWFTNNQIKAIHDKYLLLRQEIL